MTIAELQRLQSIQRPERSGDGFADLPSPAGPNESGDSSFKDTLQNAIDEVDGAQKTANDEVQAFISGEKKNLHDVMLSMEEAKVSFQLMTEVRNKSLEAYQELMRMQV